MALAGARTQLEESVNGTLYGVHTETVAVQGDNGELIAGVRQIAFAAKHLPNGALHLFTRTQEAVGVMRTGGRPTIPPSTEENLSCSSISCVCFLAILLVLILLYLVASPIAVITVTAQGQPTYAYVSAPCSIDRTAAFANTAASFLLIIVCLCCTITCCGLFYDRSNDESGLGTCCFYLLVILLFLVMLALLAPFIAENVVVFSDIGGLNCGDVIPPSYISAILIDVAVCLIVLILLFFGCIKCCAKLVD